MLYKNLTCPSCEKKILSSDININKAIAKCSYCHVVFDLKPEDEGRETPPRKEEIFVIPKGIEVLKMFSELNIEMTWRYGASKFLFFFAVLWNAFLVPFILIGVLSQEYMMLIFISGHVAVGVGLIYYCLSYLFNTTYITVDEYNLIIEHRPFKLFFKEHHIEVKQIEQLYVKKYVASTTNNQPNHAYMLVAILKNKDEINIIKGIHKPSQALFIEQEIENFANIKDRPVDGEI